MPVLSVDQNRAALLDRISNLPRMAHAAVRNVVRVGAVLAGRNVDFASIPYRSEHSVSQRARVAQSNNSAQYARRSSINASATTSCCSRTASRPTTTVRMPGSPRSRFLFSRGQCSGKGPAAASRAWRATCIQAISRLCPARRPRPPTRSVSDRRAGLYAAGADRSGGRAVRRSVPAM